MLVVIQPRVNRWVTAATRDAAKNPAARSACTQTRPAPPSARKTIAATRCSSARWTPRVAVGSAADDGTPPSARTAASKRSAAVIVDRAGRPGVKRAATPEDLAYPGLSL